MKVFNVFFFLEICCQGVCDENRKDVKGSAPLAIGLAIATAILSTVRKRANIKKTIIIKVGQKTTCFYSFINSASFKFNSFLSLKSKRTLFFLCDDIWLCVRDLAFLLTFTLNIIFFYFMTKKGYLHRRQLEPCSFPRTGTDQQQMDLSLGKK